MSKRHNVYVSCPQCNTLLHVYNNMNLDGEVVVKGMTKVVTTMLLYRHHPHFEGNILCSPVGPRKWPQMLYEVEEAPLTYQQTKLQCV